MRRDLADPILPGAQRIKTELRASAFTQRAYNAPTVEIRRGGQLIDSTDGRVRDASKFVETIEIAASVFAGVSTEGPNDAGVAIAPAGPTPIISLTLEGRSYELLPVSVMFDRKSQTRNVTAVLLNAQEGYGRFSITLDGFVAGTLALPDRTYRILPENTTTQLVYRIAGSADSRSQRWKKIAGLAMSDRVRDLESRHAQLEQLADLGPEMSLTNETGGTVILRGGRLGNLAQNASSASVASVLKRYSGLASVSGPIKVRVKQVLSSSAGRQIEFEQLIHGIPVRRRGFIRLDNDGSIREISARLVAQESVSIDRILGEKMALKQAFSAVEQKTKRAGGEIELINPPELYYETAPGEAKVTPEYVIDLRAGDFNWRVRVNAHTGASEAFDPRQFEDAFGYRVCRDNSVTAHPTTCSSAGADVIWTRVFGGNVRCPYRDPRNPDSLCHQTDPAEANRALGEANSILGEIHNANPDYCCDLLGGADRTIDLVYRTSGAPADSNIAYYDPTTQSILSQQASTGLRNIETTWHELGHHVLYVYNPEVSQLYRRPGQDFASTLIEAYGDLMSASLQMGTVYTQWAGDPWVMGDGLHVPSGHTTRNLRDTRLTFEHLNRGELTYLERGRAIGNFFFRVKNASGITDRRFRELVLQVGDRLTDFDGNGLDLIDLKHALLVAAGSETALINAVNGAIR